MTNRSDDSKRSGKADNPFRQVRTKPPSTSQRKPPSSSEKPAAATPPRPSPRLSSEVPAKTTQQRTPSTTKARRDASSANINLPPISTGGGIRLINLLSRLLGGTFRSWRWLLIFIFRLFAGAVRGYRGLGARSKIIVLIGIIGSVLVAPNLINNVLSNLLGIEMIPSGPISSIFTPSIQYWKNDIARWSQMYGVDANIIATLMQIESCGLRSAASFAGAQGLFQVMPMHFTEVESTRMTDPEINAKRGIGVIKECLGYSDGDVGLAMACYNAGPSVIYRARSGWPQETQNYYTWGTGIYTDAQQHLRVSPAVQTWLSAGGVHLCEQANQALGLPTSTPTPANYIPPTINPYQPTMAPSAPNNNPPWPAPTPMANPTFPSGPLPTSVVR